MKKMSQQMRILARMRKTGSISNDWAIANGIWRLGARIWDLNYLGMRITGLSGRDLGKPRKYWKVHYYFFEKDL